MPAATRRRNRPRGGADLTEIFEDAAQAIGLEAPEVTPIETPDEVPKPIAFRDVKLLENLKKYSGRMVVIQETDGRYWRAPLGTSHTTNLSEAHTIKYEGIKAHWGSSQMVVFLAEEKLPPGKKCIFNKHVTPELLELAKVAPTNTQLLGHVLAIFGKMPPATCDTFRKLVNWVEANCELGSPATVDSPTTPRRTGLNIEVEFSDMEIGRCHYSVARSGSSEYTIGHDRLMRMVSEADNLDDLMTSVREHVEENAEPENMEWDEDGASYQSYDASDYTDASTNVPTQPLGRRMREYLQEHLSAEQKERLGF